MSSIAILLNDQEQRAFTQLLDTALRHAGMGALEVVAHFKAKVEAAHNGTSRPSYPNDSVAATAGRNAKSGNAAENRVNSDGN
jgi:hypothetical protein